MASVDEPSELKVVNVIDLGLEDITDNASCDRNNTWCAVIQLIEDKAT